MRSGPKKDRAGKESAGTNIRDIACPGAASVRHAGFNEVRELWDSLEKTGCPYPFQRRSWIECWTETVGKTSKARTVIAIFRDGQGKQALLPLAIHIHAGMATLTQAGAPVSDYTTLLAEPGFSADCRSIYGELKNIARELDCPVLDLGHIAGLDAAGMPSPLVPATEKVEGFMFEHVSAHRVKAPDCMEKYLASRFSPKARYTLRRAEKKLAGTFQTDPPPCLEWREAASLQEGEVILDRLIGFKRARYEGTRELDPFSLPGVDAFYREAWRRSLPGLRLAALESGGTIVAASLGILDTGTYYVLIPGFDTDEKIARHSPGMLISLRIIQEAAEAGANLVDFTVGDEDYKKKLCDTDMKLGRFLCATSLHALPRVFMERMLATMKHDEGILSLGRKLRRFMKNLRKDLRKPADMKLNAVPGVSLPVPEKRTRRRQ